MPLHTYAAAADTLMDAAASAMMPLMPPLIIRHYLLRAMFDMLLAYARAAMLPPFRLMPLAAMPPRHRLYFIATLRCYDTDITP